MSDELWVMKDKFNSIYFRGKIREEGEIRK